jgi:hypothetical protein
MVKHDFYFDPTGRSSSVASLVNAETQGEQLARQPTLRVGGKLRTGGRRVDRNSEGDRLRQRRKRNQPRAAIVGQQARSHSRMGKLPVEPGKPKNPKVFLTVRICD